MTKIKNIQAMRGIAALMVLIYHLMLAESMYQPGKFVLSDFWFVGNAGVDIFFIISGFVMVHISKSRSEEEPYIGRFLLDRFTRIFPPYWLASSIVLIVILIRPQVSNVHTNGLNFVTSFLLIPQKNYPLLHVGWTLAHEIYFYLVFALILLQGRKNLLRCLVVWSGVVSVGTWLTGPAGPSNPLFAMMLNPLTIEFVGGCLMCILLDKFKRFDVGFGFISLILGLLGLVAVTYFGALPDGGMIWGFDAGKKAVMLGLPSFFVVLGVVEIERANGMLLGRFLERMGDASFAIYLWHLPVLAFLYRVAPSLFPIVAENSSLRLSLALFMSLVAGYVALHLVERPLLQFSRMCLKRCP